MLAIYNMKNQSENTIRMTKIAIFQENAILIYYY